MAILVLLSVAVFVLVLDYIRLFYKEYPNRHYYLFEVTDYVEYFDEAYQDICSFPLTRVYRFHSKERTWQEAKVIKTFLYEDHRGGMSVKSIYIWKNVTPYRAKRLNKETQRN